MLPSHIVPSNTRLGVQTPKPQRTLISAACEKSWTCSWRKREKVQDPTKLQSRLDPKLIYGSLVRQGRSETEQSTHPRSAVVLALSTPASQLDFGPKKDPTWRSGKSQGSRPLSRLLVSNPSWKRALPPLQPPIFNHPSPTKARPNA